MPLGLTSSIERFVFVAVLVLCCAAAFACGDDDSASMTNGAGTDGGADANISPSDAATGTQTNTGTGGTISSSGAGGTTMPVMRVPCGQNSCAPNPLGLSACCADQTIGLCGTMMGNSCSSPPKVDPSCPKITIPIAGEVGSCCADNGKCGLDGSLLGMGCVDYKTLTSSLGVLGGVFTLPPAQHCGEDDAGAIHGDEDAGH